MKTFQSGPIQSNFQDNGKFSHYRLTFPVPKEMSDKIDIRYQMVIKNKLFFVFISEDWDEINYQMAACQVMVNDYKVCKYEQKRINALNNLAAFAK